MIENLVRCHEEHKIGMLLMWLAGISGDIFCYLQGNGLMRAQMRKLNLIIASGEKKKKNAKQIC